MDEGSSKAVSVAPPVNSSSDNESDEGYAVWVSECRLDKREYTGPHKAYLKEKPSTDSSSIHFTHEVKHEIPQDTESELSRLARRDAFLLDQMGGVSVDSLSIKSQNYGEIPIEINVEGVEVIVPG